MVVVVGGPSNVNRKRLQNELDSLKRRDYSPTSSHLLEPRSRREFALDMPVDGENAIGEEKPERGSAADRTHS